MSGKLFGRTNYNDIIFRIEQQEGSQILGGDMGIASIGDATMNHIQNLGGLGRMAWDEFLCMPDGNLFAIRENTRWVDPDEYNLGDKTEKEMFLKRNKIPEKHHKYYDDAVIMEEQRRLNEDVLGHKEELVSYDNWERFPQQWNRWDIPTTPKPKKVFVGNAKKMFYDVFSNDGEPHPLEAQVLSIVMILDKFRWEYILTRRLIAESNKTSVIKRIRQAEPDQWIEEGGRRRKKRRMSPAYIFTDEEIEYLHAELFCAHIERVLIPRDTSKLSSMKLKQHMHTYEMLKQLTLDIANGVKGFPIDLAEKYLSEIDRFEFLRYKRIASYQTKIQDPLYTYLAVTGRKFISIANEKPEVYNEWKKMGREFFLNGFVCERVITREKVNGRWGKVDPHKKVDVQRMRKHHWTKYHDVKGQLEVIIARKKQRVGPVAREWINKLRSSARQAEKTRNLRLYTKNAEVLINGHKSGTIEMSKQDWQVVWGLYNKGKAWVIGRLSSKEKNERQ